MILTATDTSGENTRYPGVLHRKCRQHQRKHCKPEAEALQSRSRSTKHQQCMRCQRDPGYTCTVRACPMSKVTRPALPCILTEPSSYDQHDYIGSSFNYHGFTTFSAFLMGTRIQGSTDRRPFRGPTDQRNRPRFRQLMHIRTLRYLQLHTPMYVAAEATKCARNAAASHAGVS